MVSTSTFGSVASRSSKIVRRELIVPFEFARFGVECQNAVGVEIIARTIFIF